MTPDDAGSDRVEADRVEADRIEVESGDSAKVRERVAQLLTDLADDPNVPPSRVTAMSVIAAAKATAQADLAAPPSNQRVAPDGPAEAGESARTADVVEFRPRLRRFALAGLVAAASLAGVSALVISLTVSGGSSTSTSADGARAASAEPASSVGSEAAPEPAGAELAGPPAADASAANPAAPGQPEAAAGAAPDTSVAAGNSVAAGSGAAADTAATGCWPALSDQALAALTDALPPGAFGSPVQLTADCEPPPVAGAILPGIALGTALVVRVTNSVPGACVSDTSRGTSCAARGDNIFTASDAAGSPVVYAYGKGNQVVVSGWPAAGDSVAIKSGLTVEQSVTAAEAVLGAVG